jgi:hypothetical protein
MSVGDVGNWPASAALAVQSGGKRRAEAQSANIKLARELGTPILFA